MFSAQHKFGRLGAPAGRSLEAQIAALFPDVWYDPSDLTALFQDSSGTTPVTSLEQPVGLMKDKSGNNRHAYHTPGDTTTRPVVSRRINLLTKTEDFSDSVWNAGSLRTLQVSANATTAPDGTVTADKVVEAAAGAGSVLHRAVFSDSSATSKKTFSVYAKKAERKRLYLFVNGPGQGAWFDLDLGTCGAATDYSGGSAAISGPDAYGFYKCSLSPSTVSGGGYIQACVIRDSATTFDTRVGDGTSGIYIWGASLVPADLAALGYQRVNTATDYDSSEPFKQAASLDGANDAMQTSSGGGGTTAFFFCAAIQAKQTGATQTLWSDTGTNTGYRVRINSSNQLELSAGNGSAYTTVNTTATLAVGQRAVVTAWHDGVNLNVQINSGTVAQAAFATATAGTAGFSLGKDNGAASSFFRGWIYESLYKKDVAMSASQIATAQRYCAAKAGITL